LDRTVCPRPGIRSRIAARVVNFLEDFRASTLNTTPAVARVVERGIAEDLWLRATLVNKYETADSYRPRSETLTQWAEAGIGVALDLDQRPAETAHRPGGRPAALFLTPTEREPPGQ